MKKRLLTVTILVLTVSLLFQSAAFAFSDIGGNKAEKEILLLKERGIIKGLNEQSFLPNETLTYATAVTLLVRALDLNLDHIRFIKEPKASDYYVNINDEKWYANYFLNAQFNGIELPKDVKPTEIITKELFAHMLYNALISKYDIAFIELWMMIDDEKDINPEFMNSIQKVLVSNIAKLDNGKFLPKSEVTRSEAALMVYQLVKLVDGVK